MTALGCYWDWTDSGRPLDQCERMLRAQQVYAPDAGSCRSDGPVAIGRRLFRLLPEDRFDREPMVGAGGTRMLVADVRLDNRAELCAELGIAPAEASQLADAAVLMRALDRWDEDAPGRLVGDFAFILWDARRHRLVMARDFIGQRPLHYHRAAGFFAAASMPKGLHALPDIPSRPNEGAVTGFLALMPETGNSSFFEGIERVPPGHVCVVTKSGVASSRYWNPARKLLRLRRSSDYAEAVREQMDVAVRARLRGAESKVGAHLSGGLDSSAVCATAARLLPPGGQVAAFTSVPREGYEGPVPRGRFGDEGPLAASLAALYPNIEHVRIETAGRSPLASLDRNFFLFERPTLNLCNLVWFNAIMDAAKERGLSVMLTGQMGNMSFSYAGLELLPELLASGRFVRLAKEAFQLPRKGIRLESVIAHTIGPFLSAGAWRTVNRWRGRHFRIGDYSAVNLERAEGLRAKAAEDGLDFSYRPRRDPFGTRRWVLGRVDQGNYNKGCLAGWGIDHRDPTADRRLVELCLSIPAEEYLKNGETRAIARRAFADRLPQAIVRETRKGLQAIDWHEGMTAARDQVSEELERIGGVAGAGQVLELERLRKLAEDWPQGNWNSNAVQGRYRLALLRGLSGGHFMRKATGSNN